MDMIEVTNLNSVELVELSKSLEDNGVVKDNVQYTVSDLHVLREGDKEFLAFNLK